MKTSLQITSMHPALFQIAARIEALILPRVSKSALSVDQKIGTAFEISAEKSPPAKKTKNVAKRHPSLPH
jgi:hypothetical protein